MNRRKLHRKLGRFPARKLGRSLTRRCLRGRRRGPDDFSQALTAFRRAIRTHRRLARLAPRFFDPAVIDREAHNRAEQRRWLAFWEPYLARAYGTEPQLPDPDAELPPLPLPRIQAAVDRQLAELELWMEAGRLAMDRYQQRNPHALLSWSRIARLLSLAHDFKQLALGLDSPNPLPEKISYDYDFTDLKRAYGQPPAAATEPASAAPVSSNPTPPPGAPAWPPPDDKCDYVPRRLVIGPHGLLCLEPIAPGSAG